MLKSLFLTEKYEQNWSVCVCVCSSTCLTQASNFIGCQISLPVVLKGVCVYTKDCLAIQCCVPVNLGLLGEYAVDASFEVDTCNNTFTYTLERKSAKLSLPAITGENILSVPHTHIYIWKRSRLFSVFLVGIFISQNIFNVPMYVSVCSRLFCVPHI